MTRQIMKLSMISVGVVLAFVAIYLSISEWSPHAIRYSVRCDTEKRLFIFFDQNTISYEQTPFSTISFSELSSSEPRLIGTMWQICREDRYLKHNYDKVLSLTYGICPPGFEEQVAPKPLIAGHYYMLDNAPSFVIIKRVDAFELISYDDYVKLVSRN